MKIMGSREPIKPERLGEAIAHTVHTLQRTNAMINLHQQADASDPFAVQQYERIRADLIRQLNDMLIQVDERLRLAA